ncbi:MAG: hypothetical protein ABFD62_05360 [Syntrophaceae bacterium]
MSERVSGVTTDHGKIRKWAEERQGRPAKVKGTGAKEDIGMIRLDFPGYSGEGSLEEISWDQFFEEFEKRKLALLYEEKTAKGETSRFNKIISREESPKRKRH